MFSRKPKTPPPDGHLPWWKAVGHALTGRDIEFYPRIVEAEGQEPRSLSSPDILAHAARETKEWPAQFDKDALEDALARARESLDEAKALTEYQDQKATRLLTVATFLTAFSGVLFNRFAESYPLRTTLEQGLSLAAIIVPIGYILFAFFVLAAVSGALVTFHATRTRFKYPQAHSDDFARQEADPKSMVFANAIIRVSPGAWARAFVGRPEAADAAQEPAAQPGLRPDLQARYLQNYVTESYLIAAKTADKLRYLQPAQWLLSMALTCLLVWLLTLAAIAAFIDATKPAAAPAVMRLETPGTPIPVTVSSSPPSGTLLGPGQAPPAPKSQAAPPPPESPTANPAGKP